MLTYKEGCFRMGSIFSKIVSYWQGQPQIESQPQPTSRPKPQSKPQSKPKPKPQSKPKPKPQSKPQSKPQPKLHPESQTSDFVQNYEIVDYNETQCVKYDGLIYDTLSNEVTHPGPCLWQLLEAHGISESDLRIAATSAGNRTEGRIKYNESVFNTDLETLFDELNSLGYSIGYVLVHWQMGKSTILEAGSYNERAMIVLRLMLMGDEHGGHYIEPENYNHRYSRFSLSSSKEFEDDSTSSKKSIDEDAEFSDDVSLDGDSSDSEEESDEHDKKVSPIARVKGAQRRFFARKKKGTRSFVTSSTKPKFAGPLNVAESIKDTPKEHTNKSKGRNAGKKEHVSWHEIRTPFGKVILKVVYKKDNTVLARLIVNEVGSDEAMRYEEIFNILDESCKKTPMEMISLARIILDYLSTELSLEDIDAPDILARFNSKFRDSLPSDNVEKAAATLCAILMFCESCELRNATGGKLERGFMRRVIRNMEDGISNPFKTAAEGHYPPHLNPAQSSSMGGVAATRDALGIDGPQTTEGKKRADGISELGSDVSGDSDKNSHESSDEDKK